MKTCYPILLLLSPLLAQATILPSLDRVPVTLTVLNTEGQPVEGARVEASLHGPGNATGTTGPDGTLILNLNRGANLTLQVSRDGYYATGGRIWDGGVYKGPDGKLTARELPKAFTIELKAVRDPVFLHHRRFRGHAPKVGEPAGFDLRIGDWVAPHGKGRVPDLRFRFFDVAVDGEAYRGSLEISFPNPGDGLQSFQAARPFSNEFGSDLAPPHRAPVEGYQESWTFRQAYTPGSPPELDSVPQRNFLLRTRTEQDADGRIIAACYGWVQGEFQFDPRSEDGPQLVFTYFFNPDPDPEARSLEYNLHVPR